MTLLSVNVNKIALVRNSRDIGIPNVLECARICVEAGAHGITVHPRPDLRHIRPSDVHDLSKALTVEFNIEGNPFEGSNGPYPGFMPLVREVRPTQCTLVPDAPGQLTSDHGWDLTQNTERLRPVVGELQSLGIRVSLFLDPVLEQVDRAAELGTDRIELYTEPYARAFERGQADESIRTYARAAERAVERGLGVNAGHDLNLDNLPRFVKEVPSVLEVSIGHALVSDALKMGLRSTVEAYLDALRQ